MLEGYGLHQLTWDTCDERFGDVLVASPADSGGRGISLTVRQNGAAANLTGATVYFVWCHKVTGEHGHAFRQRHARRHGACQDVRIRLP
ncbi:MAG: hypothetical protein IKG18_02735 [Atopobiaceae bacterium]|nr:hypothetical protein [Atopobiaceae bacterium]